MPVFVRDGSMRWVPVGERLDAESADARRSLLAVSSADADKVAAGEIVASALPGRSWRGA